MLFFKQYKNNQKIYYSQQSSNSNTFHFEFIEALKPCLLESGDRIITLSRLDIVVSEYFKDVRIKSKVTNQNCIRHFGIDLEYPSPLNQFLVANNPLVHDFMNDSARKLKYVVLTNLNDNITHNYMNLLKIFASKEFDPYIDFQAQRVSGLLFTELLRNHRDKISKIQSDFPSVTVKHASKYTQSGAIMDYIISKNGNVTLDQIANHFGYQKNYLSRLFHKLFNKDFIHFRLGIRMNLACEQLKLTTKSIEEISFELGYKDVSTFTKQFIENKGIKPSLYRKENAVFKGFES